MESLDGLLTIVVILLILFLIGRELICWYFKLNHLHTSKNSQIP